MSRIWSLIKCNACNLRMVAAASSLLLLIPDWEKMRGAEGSGEKLELAHS